MIVYVDDYLKYVGDDMRAELPEILGISLCCYYSCDLIARDYSTYFLYWLSRLTEEKNSGVKLTAENILRIIKPFKINDTIIYKGWSSKAFASWSIHKKGRVFVRVELRGTHDSYFSCDTVFSLVSQQNKREITY